MTLHDRVYNNISPEPNSGCWLWMGAGKTDAKGVERPAIQVGNRFLRVARVIYEMEYGPIPESMLVCHRCDMPQCVNPDHLFLGTTRDNHNDMTRKGRAWWQKMDDGELRSLMQKRQRQQADAGKIARGERCGSAKLTSSAVRNIRLHLAEGCTQRALAREFGVDKSTIGSIAAGKTWRHVN